MKLKDLKWHVNNFRGNETTRDINVYVGDYQNDDYLIKKYNSFNTENSQKIIETHNIIYSQKMYEENINKYGAEVVEYEFYYCEICQSDVKQIIWYDDNKPWNPITCNDLVIKKLLE